jgi:hypothetical protein
VEALAAVVQLRDGVSLVASVECARTPCSHHGLTRTTRTFSTPVEESLFTSQIRIINLIIRSFSQGTVVLRFRFGHHLSSAKAQNHGTPAVSKYVCEGITNNA